ncbi:MAG: TIGR02710 family CRISPR-associated protein [Methylomonas sp.]|nr:TIGR02710 family CRISPR-associated protein [Methylomonas sp.]PPD21142.1 MAG: TIGR02710 family CRISPR-associated protein [Methylomonas sp.]PPD27576.1 MAG: TIGR02710 family CRISPR-associated protein [Methylomonas sp.]PPD39572.1 MAG: TIGR02710 family CRISPR-associated protein [Methylomonas sp.]PPD55823.1 MAG: TIGR02710 family CRISPR-associated protein [Methylomonas sp.]
MTQILICTVGGSHQPIVSAINDMRPDYVVFVCTDKDPATGQPGSVIQIQGKGNCIKAQPKDDKPSLPNIPTQTGLADNQHDVVLTLSDHLDRIYLDCVAAIDDVGQRFPGARIVADYTGGTKSMSAGLTMAAVERPDIELQLVTGSRADLLKVRDGSQFADQADCERIRYQRLTDPYRRAWNRYAYSEAVAGLADFRPPKGMRDHYARFRDLSRAFAEWDNFNHRQALSILQPYAPKLPDAMKTHIGIALRLNDDDPAKRDAARLFDLYRNAERRATQGRYDDAVARIYRLIEWSAQWLLQTQAGIDTSNVAPEQIPDGLTLTQHRDGPWQAGLFNAWQLVKHKTDGAAARFIAEQENTLLNHLKTRNGSILAHGFAPIDALAWQPMHTWLEQQFLPMLLQETASVGIKALPPQLPQTDSEAGVTTPHTPAQPDTQIQGKRQ